MSEGESLFGRLISADEITDADITEAAAHAAAEDLVDDEDDGEIAIRVRVATEEEVDHE